MPLLKQLWAPIAAMIVVVAASNYAVQFPINDWLTLSLIHISEPTRPY